MNKNYNLKLDLQFRCNNSIMKFNQFDNNTSDFFIKISNGGKSFDVEKAIVVLAIIKPSGKVASQFVEVENGLVYADLKPNMRDEIGIYTAQAMLILEDERVVTDSISYKVEEDKIFSLLNDSVEDTEEFTLLTDMLNRLSTIEISEEQRMINEAERILSEENRKIEEAKRVEAELIRQHEEADRAKYDAIRESNENIRKQNESIRLANETNRIDEEAKRVEEEAKRVEAEQLRKDNYNFMTEDEDRRRSEANSHKEAEVLRVQAETNRVNEEAKRRTTEQARVSAENTRVGNENVRKANEETRQNNETKRVEAETQRQNRYNSFIADAEANANNFENYTNTAKVKEEERKANELDRKSQEDRRISNEVERISNENTRISNENTRKANEIAREKNETSRQNIFENKVDEVDEKIVELDTTKDNFISSINTKVDNKISELNITKDNFVSSINTKVDNKISELDTAKSDMTTTVSNKVNEVETRFNALTSSQQQDAEVIDARVDFKGVAFNSLKERIDYTDKLLRDSTISTVTTESDFTTVEATSNGYFEDVKLEGKTLVNLWGNKSSDFRYSGQTSFNSSTQCIEYTSTTNRFSNCFTKNNTQYKPDTKYTIIVNVFENTFTSTTEILKVNSAPGSGSDLGVSREMINIQGGFVGVKVFTLTTLSDLSKSNTAIRTFVDNVNAEVGAKLKFQMIVLEGDHTQNPPSFFEGLKGVGDGADEIVVESVKGDGNLVEYIELYGVKVTDGTDFTDNKYVRTNYITVKPNQTYYTKPSTNVSYNNYVVYFYDSNKSFLGYKSGLKSKFTTVANTKFIRIDMKKADGTGNTQEDVNNCDFVVSKYRVSEYIPYQSDKKRLLYYNEETQAWEKPILREWDSIEKHANGKYYYHQRSGEVVLNGSENWAMSDSNFGKFNCFYLAFNLKINGKSVLSDKFASLEPMQTEVNSVIGEGISTHHTTPSFRVVVSKSKLSTQNVVGFKQWLQANNVTVVYQLAQEKVYECTNIDLITYANETNYIVESGAIAPRSTLKVHNNISNVVSLLQKKVSLLESDVTSYMITQNRLMLASRYNADNVTFKVDYPSMMSEREVEIDYDLFKLIQDNIIVGPENYDVDKMLEIMDLYAMIGFITWEMWDYLYEVIDSQINPVIGDLEGAPEI